MTIRPLFALALVAATAPALGQEFTDQAEVLASEAAALPGRGCDNRPAPEADISTWLAWDLGLSAPREACAARGNSRWLVTWTWRDRKQRQWLPAPPGETMPVRVSVR